MVATRSATLLAVPLAAALLAGTAQAATTAGPASLTCQGKGVDRSAAARYRTEVLIQAPLHTIWNLQTDVENWPSWQKPAAPMTIKRLDPGPLRKRSRFQATIQVPPPGGTVEGPRRRPGPHRGEPHRPAGPPRLRHGPGSLAPRPQDRGRSPGLRDGSRVFHRGPGGRRKLECL